ncbi:hypothetical protein [Rubellicoccus peritrichatus]|uniref:Uncharacterized protein n=1 Tax=Rubellicoccus peritrichatus TaxID=3080537 RepID=A0AAQ3LB82_9BACT|nr:hypothetical protein [Puniceicoccus sp. CR14]WOO42102.1 hypothetical protein RZN69_03310 [Puniceicoccus sp. CR14]
MARKSRKYITILGHRFLKTDFFKWVICVVIFITVIAASWILFTLYSTQRRKEVLAEQARMEVTVEEEIPVSVGPAQPSRLDLLVKKQLKAVGYAGGESIIVNGQIIQGEEVREFEDFWSPPNKMRRELSSNGQIAEVLIYDGKEFWKVTPENKVNITDTSDAALFNVETTLYEPLAQYSKNQKHYRLLFDEEFGGRNNKVIGYRLPGEIEVRHFFDDEELFEVRRLAWLVGEKDGQRDIRFEKHEAVNGRAIPRIITFISKGKAVQIIKIREVTIQDSLPDSTFEPVLSLNN